ncbi:MAG: hypothetical protein WBP86_07880, partial [Thiobacillaceae bacterium]
MAMRSALNKFNSTSVAIAGALAIALLIWAGFAGARVIQGIPENYVELVQSLSPGDTLQLSPGSYTRGLLVHELMGRPDQPITIAGP